MHKRFVFTIVALMSAGVLSAAEPAAVPLHPWEKVEIVLTAAKDYPNPYVDVETWVELSGPGFAKRCYGFWDGGRTYRVRVVATAPGEWTWRSGSNQDDPGLNSKAGSFTATAWTEDEKQANPVRRGFLRATPNGRALQYADGTPCFVQGEFMYPTGTWRYRWRDTDESYDVATPEAGFKDYIRHRQALGFNMIFVISCFPTWSYDDGAPREALDGPDVGTKNPKAAKVRMRSSWAHGDEDRAMNMHDENNQRPFLFPGPSGTSRPEVGPDMFRINPRYFDNLDKKIDYANRQGFVVLLESLRRDIGPYLKAYYGITDPDPLRNALFLYDRWLFARYQANSTIFGPTHLDRVDALDMTLPVKDWRVGIDAYYHRYGPHPFGQLVSVNPSPTTYAMWGHTDKTPWLSIHMAGNSPRDHTMANHILKMFNLPNPLPIFFQEPSYIESDSDLDRYKNRVCTYSGLLSGGLVGVAYQAYGMNRGNREIPDKRFPPMWKAAKWISATEMRHAATFMLTHGARYQELKPANELLSVSRQGKSFFEGWSFCMRTDDKRLFKFYFEKNAARAELSGVSPGTAYQAQWFNPRTGQWTDAGEEGVIRASTEAVLALPPCPTANEDWCLSLSSE